jgi:hypothetical protein
MRGRRTPDEVIAQARRLRSEGMSAAKVAKLLGMGVQTIYNLDMERPEFESVEVCRCGGCGNKVYYSPCQICESGL